MKTAKLKKKVTIAEPAQVCPKCSMGPILHVLYSNGMAKYACHDCKWEMRISDPSETRHVDV